MERYSDGVIFINEIHRRKVHKSLWENNEKMRLKYKILLDKFRIL